MTSLIYRQRTGALIDASSMRVVGVCYSGNGKGLNNPEMERIVNVGPIPSGDYRIGRFQIPETHLGPLTFPLVPVPGNTANGRSGFYIHGDNVSLDHSASCGCIVAPRIIREIVGGYVGMVLSVVPGGSPRTARPSPPADVEPGVTLSALRAELQSDTDAFADEMGGSCSTSSNSHQRATIGLEYETARENSPVD